MRIAPWDVSSLERRLKERSPGSSSSARVVVVTGLPRSGTSMLMQMLAAGGLEPFADARRAADDDNPHGYLEHEAVRRIREDASWMAQARSKAVKVVVPLVRHLPRGFEYAVVLITRELDEVLASQATMLRRQGRPGADPSVLRPVYARQIEQVREDVGQRADVAMLEVEHREVLRDPIGMARTIVEHVALALDVGAMAAAVDPTLHRHRAG